jgi:hypothetical protein
MTTFWHKSGAIFYILWGILHVGLGALILYRLGTEGGVAALAQIGTAVPPADLPRSLPHVASGVLGQHAWNLALFGLFALVVGILGNWRNSWLGYWLNLAVVSGADLGFIFAIVLPRYNTLFDGLAGPILWVLAAICSTIGILREPRNT